MAIRAFGGGRSENDGIKSCLTLLKFSPQGVLQDPWVLGLPRGGWDVGLGEQVWSGAGGDDASRQTLARSFQAQDVLGAGVEDGGWGGGVAVWLRGGGAVEGGGGGGW